MKDSESVGPDVRLEPRPIRPSGEGRGLVDLTKLERMVGVYDAGSFRKAGKALGVSQPAITWSIQQLEEAFNARLFERGPRGIQPTALCERLVRRAKLILREQERILDEAETSSQIQTIRLGVHSIVLNDSFARCIARFSDKWPQVTLHIRESYSSDLLELLQRGQVDLICCALPGDDEHDGSLMLEPLATLNYSVVARAGHPVFADIAAGRQIGTYPWVEFDTSIVGRFPGGHDMPALLARAGNDVGRHSVKTASMHLIRLLVSRGDFVGLIADDEVASELASGVVERLPGTQIAASRFGFVNLKDIYETSATRELKDMLRTSAFGPMLDAKTTDID